jgi:hypothetical protein
MFEQNGVSFDNSVIVVKNIFFSKTTELKIVFFLCDSTAREVQRRNEVKKKERKKME